MRGLPAQYDLTCGSVVHDNSVIRAGKRQFGVQLGQVERRGLHTIDGGLENRHVQVCAQLVHPVAV